MTTQAKPSKKVNIGFTILVIIILAVSMAIYGPLSYVYREADTNLPTVLEKFPLIVTQTLFTLVGFGLLLTTSKHCRWTGLGIALFVVSFNHLISPLLQKCFFEIFFGFRTAGTQTPMVTNFWDKQIAVGRITVGELSLRLTNLVSISYLTALTATVGRVHIMGVLISVIFFNVMFYLNFYINALISFSTRNKSESFIYLDDYGTILVFLFGGMAGLLSGVINKKARTEMLLDEEKHGRNSINFSITGSFFLFAAFITSNTGIIDGINFFRLNSGATMVIFSLVGGVIGNFVGAVFTGKGILDARIMNEGMIAGGIVAGVLAGEFNNLGIAILIGFGAGVFSGIFTQVVRPKMNRNSIIDSQGIVGSVVISSIFAAFCLAPSMLNQLYIRRDYVWVVNKGSPETDFRVARYHLIYFAVTLVFGIVTGAITGIMQKIGNNSTNYMDVKFFADDFGLYDDREVFRPPSEKINYPMPASESHINRETAM